MIATGPIIYIWSRSVCAVRVSPGLNKALSEDMNRLVLECATMQISTRETLVLSLRDRMVFRAVLNWFPRPSA